jgi:hypothetical protein
MDNVTFFTSELDGTEWALIDRGNEQFTSMLKSIYDAMQAEQSTPIDTLPSNSAPADKPAK